MPPNTADPLSTPVRLGLGPDLAAAVPHLLGFAPRESLVLVALTGAREKRVGVTLRVDLPPPGLEAVLAAQTVRTLADIDPAAVVVLLFTDAPDDAGPAIGPRALPDDGAQPGQGAVLPGRELLTEVVGQLADAGIEVPDSLLVRAGRCWSYECAEPCCAPGAGRLLPAGTTPLAVASAVGGQVLAADREELVARLEPTGGEEARAVATACTQVGAEQAALLEASGWEAAAGAGWQHVLDGLARCAPGAAGGLSDHDIARVGFALVDAPLRDRALRLSIGPDAAAAETLWTQLTRRLPTPLDAAPATLLAVTAWSRGDGATANTALDRALASRPDYALAQLLRSALDAALPPAALRRLVTAASADTDADPDSSARDVPVSGTVARHAEVQPGFRAARAVPSPHPARGRRERR